MSCTAIRLTYTHACIEERKKFKTIYNEIGVPSRIDGKKVLYLPTFDFQ